jgi:hypothetical protein
MKKMHYSSHKVKSTSSVKPVHGNYGGPPTTTMASNAGNSGRKIVAPPFKKNPAQK